MPKLIEVHPGEILKTEFLEPMHISPYALSQAIHVTAPRINDVVLEKRGITADMALRLARYFGTTPQFWSNLQAEYERRVAANALSAKELSAIIPASQVSIGLDRRKNTPVAVFRKELTQAREGFPLRKTSTGPFAAKRARTKRAAASAAAAKG